MRIETDAAEDGENAAARARIHQLRRGQIEGQEQLARPGQRRLGRLAQQRLRERVDEAALLGERHEDGRRNEAEIGIVPARQRLEADDMIVGERDDRLEMHVDRVGNDGVAQRLFELRRALHLLGDLCGIDGDLAAAAPLGAVERRLGALEQILEFVAGKGIDGKAEGGREADVAVAEIVGRRQHFADHLPEFLGARALEDQRQHEGKLVAVVAGDRRAVGNAGLEAMGDLAEDFVAGVGAEQIVDRLEGVEIGDADGERRRIAGALGRQYLRDAVPHAIAVAQPRQRIGISHRLQAHSGLQARNGISADFIAQTQDFPHIGGRDGEQVLKIR